MWKWYKSDLDKVEKNGIKVFSTFSCGGGSSFGYKLAGCDVLGNVEIDKKMNELYIRNHNPRYNFSMDIRDFKELPEEEIPQELFNLDILDGSPPCSSFSMSGNRSKDWGKAKKFKEGQAQQVLDDLFFHFIDVAEKLQPKVVIAENVKGLLAGNAKGYVKEIISRYNKAGYETQIFSFNSALMGVPQARERVFFISKRKDLKIPKINIKYDDKPIPFREIEENVNNVFGKPISKTLRKYFFKTPGGRPLSYAHPKGSYFNYAKVAPNRVCPTVTASDNGLMHYKEPYYLSDEAIKGIQTFPQDYDFNGESVKYVCGMSVPPKMMEKVVKKVIEQCFKKDDVD